MEARIIFSQAFKRRLLIPWGNGSLSPPILFPPSCHILPVSNRSLPHTLISFMVNSWEHHFSMGFLVYAKQIESGRWNSFRGEIVKMAPQIHCLHFSRSHQMNLAVNIIRIS